MLKKSLFTIYLFGAAASSYAATTPELPRMYVDTSMPSTSITKTVCESGCDYTNNQLQQALNEAQLGTTILLQPGMNYTPLDDRGFILPNKTTGTGWIVLRTAAPNSSLPSPGTRLTPSYSSVLPKLLRSPYGLYALTCDVSAHHYRIIGIEMMNPGNVDTARGGGGAFVNCVSSQETSLALQSHHIVFDRVYIHGPSAPQSAGVKFGIVFGGQHQGVIESTIEDITFGSDSITVASWAGAGPFVIRNNALSSGGENIMFGGSDPTVTNLVPSDIEIRHNYIYKPTKWRDDPAYSTGTYRILAKNLLELKNAQRVLIDGNIFENMWPSAQVGYAMTLTPRQGGLRTTACDPDGCAPWTIVQDITITNNVVKSTANGITISGQDHNDTTHYATLPGGRFLVKNNLLINSGGYAATGKMFSVVNGVSDVQIIHNTVASFNPDNASTGVAFDLAGTTTTGELLQNLVIRDNLVLARYYPFAANVNGSFQAVLTGVETIAPGYVWTNTVVAGPWASGGGIKISNMPQGNGNDYPAGESNIGYVNMTSGDYHLIAGSPYKSAASDRQDIGVDWPSFDLAQDATNITSVSLASTTSTTTSTTASSTTTTTTATSTTTSSTPTTTTTTDTTTTSSGRFLGKLKKLMDKVR